MQVAIAAVCTNLAATLQSPAHPEVPGNRAIQPVSLNCCLLRTLLPPPSSKIAWVRAVAFHAGINLYNKSGRERQLRSFQPPPSRFRSILPALPLARCEPCQKWVATHSDQARVKRSWTFAATVAGSCTALRKTGPDGAAMPTRCPRCRCPRPMMALTLRSQGYARLTSATHKASAQRVRPA